MGRNEERTTEGLVRRALADDAQAFAELVQHLRGRLEMWISLRMGPLLRSRLSEQDVLQETLLQAYRSLGTFRDRGPGSFQRWMFSVAENRLRDLHKYHTAERRSPEREVPMAPRSRGERDLLRTIPADGTSPSSAAGRRELSALLVRRIESLEQDLRDVIRLRAIEQRPFDEIATALERSPTGVKVLYVRALKRLKDELAT